MYWSATSSSATVWGPTSCSAATWRLSGVALDRLEQPDLWVIELAQRGAGGDGRFIASEDLLQRLNRRSRGDGVGPDDGVGVAVADHLEVQVVGGAASGEHRVQLWS